MGKNAVVSLVSLVAALFCLEVWLRVFPHRDLQTNDPYRYVLSDGNLSSGFRLGSRREIYPLQYDFRGYYHPSFGVVEYHNDGFGGRWLRSEERSLKAHVGIAVGDSYTYGFGLRYEDSFVFQLSQMLPGWDFVNLAKPAANAADALRQYQERQSEIPHQVLLYGLHLNDLIEFPASYLVVNAALGSFPARHSALIDFLLRKWDATVGRQVRIREITSKETLSRAFFRYNFDAILQMRDLCRARGCSFYVAMLPLLVDLQHEPFAPVFEEVRRRLTASGVTVINLTGTVRGREDKDLWITPFDQHPNEIANRLFALELAAILRPQLVPPSLLRDTAPLPPR